MKFVIKHELKGRIRIHVRQRKMSYREADILLYYLSSLSCVTKASVQRRTEGATIYYTGTRDDIIEALRRFQYDQVTIPDALLNNSGREMSERYQGKLITNAVLHYGSKLFVPYPIRVGIAVIKAIPYIGAGLKSLLHRKLEVSVLDATAISVSLIRGDINTANSVMFLLGVGDILDEWTRKKSVDDLARSLSLNIDQVWLLREGQEVLVPSTEIQPGDAVVVRTGNILPFDGKIIQGEAMINQASLTGENLPVHRQPGSTVYAGTAVEEGNIVLEVGEMENGSRFEQIVAMIEETEKLKSSLEGKAAHLADKLVPYTLAGTGLTYFITRNVTKTLSVLMVDFSCALKLAMPVAVLSAIREASHYQITVKGGKFLEAMAEADTIVFDKTGTLTKAQPTVVDVVSFDGREPDELLRIAACLEEHFPHSMAKAVVDAAKEKNLEHEEMHSQVEYIVAHGISSRIGEKKVVIGSYHFVFEDEGCTVPDGYHERFHSLPAQYSHLYMAIDSVLSAVICIEDPLRGESVAVIQSLKKAGFTKIVMLTGDSERTARAIAEKVGVDEYLSELLPEDKARYVEKEKENGKKVVMIGDGINDSPALSAADVGIAIHDGAELARTIADVVMSADDLYEIVTFKSISDALVERIRKNYRVIVGFNTGLIVLGIGGIIQPATSALLHNTSTLAIGLKSMQNLLGSPLGMVERNTDAKSKN